MKRRSHLRTEAWLLTGISSIPGALRLSGGRLSFTAFGAGNCGRRKLRKLEAETGQEGLAKRLGDDEHAVVFDVPLADVQEATFPWYYFTGGVKLTLDGARYRFGFARPANTKLPSDGLGLDDIAKARRSGKAWKAVLSERSNG